MKEEDLYQPVADFIKGQFGCFYVGIKKGIELGNIDVVALRYVMGKYGGSTEVIAVEVKPKDRTFLKCAGQAYAYSVMADRCYLAIQQTLTQAQKDVAAQLQIGLIKISKHKRCCVVVSSPKQRPLRARRLALIRTCGRVECVLCGSLVEIKGMQTQGVRINIASVLRRKNGFRYRLTDFHGQPTRDRRCLCKDCVQAFAGLQSATK